MWLNLFNDFGLVPYFVIIHKLVRLPEQDIFSPIAQLGNKMQIKSFALLMLWVMIAPVNAANITVSAAASLKEAFQQIAQNYEKQYPQDKIRLNTAASGALLQQIAQGAPVDVLASADQATMDQAQQKQLIDGRTRRYFAQNTLMMVSPKRLDHALTGLQDVQQAAVKRIAIGKPESVPAGKYAHDALLRAHLFHSLKSKYIYTQNVRQALDYVVRGEVDVAFVYRTDALLKPNALNIVAQVPTAPIVYPIAVTRNSQDAIAAKRFVDYVVSAHGQAVLQRFGFRQP